MTRALKNLIAEVQTLAADLEAIERKRRMQVRFLALFAAAMIVAMGLMILVAGDANAYAPATDPIQTSPTSPQFDCWQDERSDWAGCRITENDR